MDNLFDKLKSTHILLRLLSSLRRLQVVSRSSLLIERNTRIFDPTLLISHSRLCFRKLQQKSRLPPGHFLILVLSLLPSVSFPTLPSATIHLRILAHSPSLCSRAHTFDPASKANLYTCPWPSMEHNLAGSALFFFFALTLQVLAINTVADCLRELLSMLYGYLDAAFVLLDRIRIVSRFRIDSRGIPL